MKNLNDELRRRAVGATVDVRAIQAAQTVAEVCAVGGRMVMEAGTNEDLARVQLAIRERAAQLGG